MVGRLTASRPVPRRLEPTRRDPVGVGPPSRGPVPPLVFAEYRVDIRYRTSEKTRNVIYPDESRRSRKPETAGSETGRADADDGRVDATALLTECRDDPIRPLFDLDQPVVREVTEELPEPLPAVLPLRGVVDADAGAEFLQRQFVELR